MDINNLKIMKDVNKIASDAMEKARLENKPVEKHIYSYGRDGKVDQQIQIYMFFKTLHGQALKTYEMIERGDPRLPDEIGEYIDQGMKTLRRDLTRARGACRLILQLIKQDLVINEMMDISDIIYKLQINEETKSIYITDKEDDDLSYITREQ